MLPCLFALCYFCTSHDTAGLFNPQTFALALFSCGIKVGPRKIENNARVIYHLSLPKSETSSINHFLDNYDFLPKYKTAIDNAIASQLPKWLAPTHIWKKEINLEPAIVFSFLCT